MLFIMRKIKFSHLEERLNNYCHEYCNDECTYVFGRHTDRLATLDKAGLHHNTSYNWVTRVVDVLWQDSQLAGEDGYMLELFLLLLLILFPVCHELIKEVVDNLGSKDAYTLPIGQLLRIPLHLHIEGKNDGVLWLPLQHGCCTHHVTPVHRADIDATKLQGNRTHSQ